MTAIATVVVTYQSAGGIGPTLEALGSQLGPGDEVVVVDSASTDGSAEAARRALPEATVVEYATNVGFAAGCTRGVAETTAPLVLFLNPDVVPQPGCLDALRAVAAEQPRWGAWQALVTLDDGTTVNTAGNVVHYLGFGWAGGLGEPADAVDPDPHAVGFGSGAALVVRREAWEQSGGFDVRYWMYGEDLDLSLRLRLAGWQIGVVPAARVVHEYAFAKGGYKWFYLERNRWWTILGAYPAPLLAALAPALAVFEIVLLAASWRGGWLRPKLRAQRAVVRELPQILARRREVQASRRISPAEFAAAFEASLDSPNLAMGRSIPGAELLQRLYWSAVLALLR